MTHQHQSGVCLARSGAAGVHGCAAPRQRLTQGGHLLLLTIYDTYGLLSRPWV